MAGHLTELQIAVLRMLEEAGEETLATVLNAFHVKAEPSCGCPDYGFQRAVGALLRDGYVEWMPQVTTRLRLIPRVAMRRAAGGLRRP